MRRLAQRFCGDAKWVGNGTLEYDCRLPEPIPADPATWSKRPASRPVVTALPGGVPWYLRPAGVVASCAATCGVSLARYLAGNGTAVNEAVGHWLAWGRPAIGQPWRDAA